MVWHSACPEGSPRALLPVQVFFDGLPASASSAVYAFAHADLCESASCLWRLWWILEGLPRQTLRRPQRLPEEREKDVSRYMAHWDTAPARTLKLPRRAT